MLEGDPARVPDRVEMEDCWFTVDYKINYEPILVLTDERKVEKKYLMLTEICQRMTTDNVLGWLFLGVLSSKLGKYGEAKRLVLEARRCYEESEFWQLRFKALGIERHLVNLETVCKKENDDECI